MRFRLKLSIRMVIFIVSAAAIVFFGTLRIIRYNFQKSAYAETMATNDSQVKKYASIVQQSLETNLDKIRTYKQLVESENPTSIENQRSFYNEILKKLFQGNKNYMAVWDSWELRFTDKNWEYQYGRVSRTYFMDKDGQINFKQDSLNLDGDDEESMYYKYKQMPQEAITEPYNYSYTGRQSDEVLETSLIVPLNINNNFGGLVGIDIKLTSLQDFIDSINARQPYDVLFLSHNGTLIAHPDKSFIGVNIAEVDSNFVKQFNGLESIQANKSSSYVLKDAQGNDSVYYTLASFKVGSSNTPWAILIAAPLTKIENQLTSDYAILSKAIIFGLLVIGLVVLIFALSILFPIQKTRNILNKLAIGEVHNIEKLAARSHDELGDMARSVNTVVDGLNKVTEFAENIGAGNYEYPFEMLSNNDDLGKAVIEMRNSLQKANIEENNRQEEARQLEWASSGINIFNRVLRVDNSDLGKLAYDIIKTLTTYLDAHMGGIYIKTDLGENEFELLSYIGFSKEKYSKRFIFPEDGVTGQCILEKETIFINDVPEDFDNIGSGLGKSIPRSILIVPLMNNQVLVGLLEIESLKEIKKYQVQFVERIAETIASTISTVKTNVRTAQLLDKAKKQAEELEQQEEEMRQNMEEMQATQEEAAKREAELESLIEGFKKLMPVIEYDTRGSVIDVNDNYLKLFKSKKSQIIGKRHKADSFMNEIEQTKHKEFWKNLSDGQVAELLEYIKSGKDNYWLIEKFIPVKDTYGLVQKVICVGIDITEQQKTESKIKQIREGSVKTKIKEAKHSSKDQIINLNQELKLIDLTYLKMVYKKDSLRIYNILKLYYDTLPPQVQELETLTNNKDYAKLKSRIGSLKTKMSYLGLKTIFNHLRDVEKLINEQKNLVEIPAIIKGIVKFWSLAQMELMQILSIPD